MQITRETDYAIRIVLCLAHQKKRMDAKTISEKTDVTLRFALKILRKLVASSIVQSYKGTQGGYELRKNPAEITLKEVIEAIEGMIAINRCLRDDFVCNYGGEGCSVHCPLRETSKIIGEHLDTITFDRL